MKEIEKAYEPKKYEDTIYKEWEESGYFNPDNLPGKRKKPYTIIMPPPNATGQLHLGHAMMLSYEDIMVRYHRMKGKKALWLPGEDHAALATNAKIEGQLQDEGTDRFAFGREKFLHRINTFVMESRNTIRKQVKKMGSSCDWDNEAYTMDESRSRAVRTMFKRMFDDELIYRGDRIVNWDPTLQTTVSDDEIERKEEKGIFYYFQYGPFVIGTARPETKFGDKYVVMHPDDDRYNEYTHGQEIELEWINGPVTATIIKDTAVDMEFGSGVMTITPWHDLVDFEIAERHDLDKEQIIDFNGNLLDIAGEFSGSHISDIRIKIVKKLKKKGLLVKTDENYMHNIAVGDRSGTTIEPQIMRQWFVNVHKKITVKGNKLFKNKSLTDVASKVVKDGDIKILPERFNKTYFHWMDNLHDWCISRQIWFGHRIPVFYCYNCNKDVIDKNVDSTTETPDNIRKIINKVGARALESAEYIVSDKDPRDVKCVKCKGGDILQDPDTLDTWFSSGIWTFSTLGWPEKTERLKMYHPTQVLETGYDIIFTWVARMILMTTYALGEVPFENVYFHGLVRDKQGRKMSKSLGNGIDPLDMINKFGADALRLSMIVGASPGNDTRLYDEKIAGYRNFVNKLWNISRFIQMSVKDPTIIKVKPKAKADEDIWILDKLSEIENSVSLDIEEFRFSKAADDLRHFTWDIVADTYVEVAKKVGGKDNILLYIQYKLLTMWHPFIPFVTETIWKKYSNENNLLMIEDWKIEKYRKNVSSVNFEHITEIIASVRSQKDIDGVPQIEQLDLKYLTNKNKVLSRNKTIIEGLTHVKMSEVSKKDSLRGYIIVGTGTYKTMTHKTSIYLSSKINVSKVQKEIEKLQIYINGIEANLSNKNFTKNAPKDIVLREKKKKEEAEEKIKQYKEQLKQT